MGLFYTANNKWETMSTGRTKPTAESSTWELGKEHQVALMLQGNKTSVYIDGRSLGEEEVPLSGEKPLELFGLCFGACNVDGYVEVTSREEMGKKPRVMVKNVFLYDRPLNSTEMQAIKDRVPVPARAPEPQVGDAPKTIETAVSAAPGPGKAPAAPAGVTTAGITANTEHAPAGNTTFAGNEGKGGETGVASSAHVRGLLPLLLLLGLWGFCG
ncbi:trans-sialidase, putative, partial [Trypanosoma cruzi marinkellei]